MARPPIDEDERNRRLRFKVLFRALMERVTPKQLSAKATDVMRKAYGSWERGFTPQDITHYRNVRDHTRVPRREAELAALCCALHELGVRTGKHATSLMADAAKLFDLMRWDSEKWLADEGGKPVPRSTETIREPSTRFVHALMQVSQLVFCSALLTDPNNANVVRLRDARSVLFDYLLQDKLWIVVSARAQNTSASKLTFQCLPALIRAYISAILYYLADPQSEHPRAHEKKVLAASQQNLHFLMLDPAENECGHTYCSIGRVYFLCLRPGYGLGADIGALRANWPLTFRGGIWAPDLLGEYAKDVTVFDATRGLELDATMGRDIELMHAPGAPIVSAMTNWLRDRVDTCVYRLTKFASYAALRKAVETGGQILVPFKATQKE